MKSTSPLLSIVIPTYNRAHVLNECLKLLLEISVVHKKNIEILVSDNDSSDKTKEVAKLHGRKLGRHSTFIYSCNYNNRGVSKNIISLFKKAKGRYILFLGDDDYIKKNNFSRILKLLSDDKSPSAIIQARWQGVTRTRKIGFVNYKYASELFYEYGNVYGGIVDRQAALNVLKNNNEILKEIEKIVWPQTVIGFLAINQLNERPIYIADFEIGGQIQSQNITNKAYWVRSLYGLLRASFLIDRYVGRSWTKKSFVRFKTKGFIYHIKAIIYKGLIAKNTDSSLVQKELQINFSWVGYFWSIILLLSDRFPRLYLWTGVVAYSFIEMKSPKFIFKKFIDAKTQYAEQLLEIKRNKKRYGDWF
jgi:glycosyltransferase involved in cell wall biosynthesis